MSGPVDVLAVMDFTIRRAEQDGKSKHPAMREARAATVELIAAARQAERLLSEMAAAGFGSPSQAVRLRLALARVQGGAA